jgi:hypothetical protein
MTMTSTPPPTPAPSGCVTLSQSTSYEGIECLGSPYTNTITTVTATLDAITNVNVLVRVNQTYQDCLNKTYYPSSTININAGDLSGFSNITTLAYVNCGGLEPACAIETRTIDTYEVLTSNYTICEP